MMANPEFRLHCAALKYIRYVCPDCIVYHIPNGEYRSKETGRKLKAAGVMPGVFDLMMIGPDGRHFHLEAKSKTGRLSPEQQWFKNELILRGVPYVVFRNLADIEAFVYQNRIPNRLTKSSRIDAAFEAHGLA
jgi:hypothetical protein